MTARAYAFAVIILLVTFIGGNRLIDDLSGDRLLNYRAAREMDYLSLAARSVSDRLSMSLSHFRSLSNQVAHWGDQVDLSALLEGLAIDEGNYLPSLLDLSWVAYDGLAHHHSSKNRSIFQQARSWGELYMSRHVESWREGWVAPFTVSPGLKTLGMIYPLWYKGAFTGVFVVTLDLELLLGHLAHHIGETGDSWILDGLGQVMFSKDPSEVGKNVFADGQGLFYHLGYLRNDIIHRSYGKDIDRLMVWHSATVQARKLILVKTISPIASKQVMTYRLALSFLTALVLMWLTALFMSSRERAWEQLAMAERRYLAVVEAQTELVIRFNPDWTVTFVNRAYCVFFDLPRERVVGESLRKFLPPDDRSSLRSVLREMASDESQEAQWTQGLLNSTRWIKWNLSQVPGAWSSGSEIQAVGRDVTSTVLLQEELRRRKEAIWAILESAPVAISLVTEGAVEMVNKSGLALKDAPVVVSLAKAVMDQGYGLYGQEITLELDGEERFMIVNVVPYGPSSKEVLVAGLDVTAERRMSRQILEERDFRYRRILNSIGDAVLLCRQGKDQRYRVDLANPAAEEITGRRGINLLGMPLSTVFNATSLKRIEALIDDSNSPVSLTGGLRRTWGENIPVEMNLMVFKDDGPTVLIVMRDISERIKASARERAYARQLRNLIGRLDRLEQEKRREMASYLHDVVGQNLASVKISLGLAKRSLGPEAEVLDGAISLVNQVIDETRTMTFELASPLLDELGLLPALERLCEKLKEDHGLSVQIFHDRSWYDLDKPQRELLFRAVRELLINVAKHGQIDRAEVKLITRGQNLVAVVSDKGVGYDSKELDRGTTNSFGLFGLKERLAQAGGELICRSAPGKGTVATVIIKRGN
ncbi:PAS domain S-box protein [Dethiosulfovibrio salsuginis]|uniref:histidine kinase n=1 Tax=Dethiosulfovibrio salsuginis TaxID=561720 RepID=A0A1X7J1T9_9BACT|nr:PAS domain S-box protein [Dethiosulfovibrio salsuginis]SMG21210.1 PAS domain S-box-containing protein/type I secretion C-terminal target domain (VC_A0849 subclass) [Dethiosulfovibrio salsuginis]